MRISQSILGNVDKCMLAAQYGIDPPSWVVRTAGSQRAVGTGYHAGLEQYYRQRVTGPGTVPHVPDMIGAAIDTFNISRTIDLYDNSPVENFKWDERVPDQETAERFMAAMLTEYVGGGHVWPHDWTVLGVEVGFAVTDPDLDGHVAKGSADLVLADPTGYVVVDDHKTAGKAWPAGKEHPRKNNQSPWYVHYMRTVYPDAVGYRMCYSIMTYPTVKSGCRFERRISDPGVEHEAAIVKKANDFANLYQEMHVKLGRDLPANPASTLCNPKWCDFFEGCPHGRVLER